MEAGLCTYICMCLLIFTFVEFYIDLTHARVLSCVPCVWPFSWFSLSPIPRLLAMLVK